MPGLDGIEATRRIGADERLAGVKVVILTAFELDEYLFDGIRAGASGFMVKDTDPVELLHALRVVARGDALLSPGVTRRLIAEYTARSAERGTPPPALNRLTARERDIAALVGTGLSNDEIAERLFLSPATARTHVSRAMVKLHARDRAQLVVFAYEAGLVQPGSPTGSTIVADRRAASLSRFGDHTETLAGAATSCPARHRRVGGQRRRRTPCLGRPSRRILKAHGTPYNAGSLTVRRRAYVKSRSPTDAENPGSDESDLWNRINRL